MAVWTVDGPCLSYAAQGANVVTTIAASSARTAVAWGWGGNFVRVTRDQGLRWWQTDFPNGVASVTQRGGKLVAGTLAVDTSQSYAYASTDGGITWHLAA